MCEDAAGVDDRAHELHLAGRAYGGCALEPFGVSARLADSAGMRHPKGGGDCVRGANGRGVHSGEFWRRVLRQKSRGSRETVHVALSEEGGGHREEKKTAGKGLGGTSAARSCFIIRNLSGGAGRKERVK